MIFFHLNHLSLFTSQHRSINCLSLVIFAIFLKSYNITVFNKVTKNRKAVFLLSTLSYSLHIISDIKGFINK